MWGAVVVPALALFLGLSLDVGYLYDVRRRAQTAADGAACQRSDGARETDQQLSDVGRAIRCRPATVSTTTTPK